MYRPTGHRTYVVVRHDLVEVVAPDGRAITLTPRPVALGTVRAPDRAGALAASAEYRRRLPPADRAAVRVWSAGTCDRGLLLSALGADGARLLRRARRQQRRPRPPEQERQP